MKFKTKFQLSFRLADPARIMFFGNILDITHDTFEEFIQSAGFTWKDWFQHGKEHACPIRHIDVNFLSPFLPGEFYDVEISIQRLGQSSFTIKHHFSKDGKENAIVIVTHAFTNRNNGFKKMDMPEDIRQKLAVYLEP